MVGLASPFLAHHHTTTPGARPQEPRRGCGITSSTRSIAFPEELVGGMSDIPIIMQLLLHASSQWLSFTKHEAQSRYYSVSFSRSGENDQQLGIRAMGIV